MNENQISIEEFIQQIISLAGEEIFDNIYMDAKELFLHGHCYEFALVLKKFITNSFIVISKDNTHCAVRFQGRVYDASGDITDTFTGHIVEKNDIAYMEENFGIPEQKFINGIRISDYLSNYIKENSNFLDKLSFYKQPDENKKNEPAK